MPQPFLSIPVASANHKLSIGLAGGGAHNIATECQVTAQVYRFGHSGFVFRNWFKHLKIV